MATPVNYRLGQLGRRLELLFHQKRPRAYEMLLMTHQAGPELETAECYFIDRMAQHNDDYINRHPCPHKGEGRMRWIVKRDAYVNAEVDREMENWVINYPKIAAKVV